MLLGSELIFYSIYRKNSVQKIKDKKIKDIKQLFKLKNNNKITIFKKQTHFVILINFFY